MKYLDRTSDVRHAAAGESGGPSWLGASVIGIGAGLAGALAAYLADPAQGRGRRARIGDQAAATIRRAGNTAEHSARGIGAIVSGKLEALTAGGTRVGPIDDVTLRDRAETTLFRDAAVPKGMINLSVERGTLVLRGEVPDHQMRERLEKQAEKIDGLWGVRNLLHLPGEPAPTEVEAVATS